MKTVLTFASLLLLTGPVALRAGQGSPVSFTVAPTAQKAGGAAGATIAFTVSGPTDVEVAVLASDGTVVRHLAAGVLGGKSAAPPLAEGLAQQITWDGKDDAGKAAGGAAGPFSVRVRAGMGTKFGRLIGDSPYTGALTAGGPSDSLAVDDKGNLYVKLASIVGGLHEAIPWHIRLLDREGKYVRTILPYAPSTDPAKVPGFSLIDSGDGLLTPASLNPLDPVLFNFGDNIYPRIVTGQLVFVDNQAARLALPGFPRVRGNVT